MARTGRPGACLALIWQRYREHFLAKSRDPDSAANAVIGRDRACGFSKRDRRSSWGLPPGSESGAFVWRDVRVPEPPPNSVEDPGVYDELADRLTQLSDEVKVLKHHNKSHLISWNVKNEALEMQLKLTTALTTKLQKVRELLPKMIVHLPPSVKSLGKEALAILKESE